MGDSCEGNSLPRCGFTRSSAAFKSLTSFCSCSALGRSLYAINMVSSSRIKPVRMAGSLGRVEFFSVELKFHPYSAAAYDRPTSCISDSDAFSMHPAIPSTDSIIRISRITDTGSSFFSLSNRFSNRLP